MKLAFCLYKYFPFGGLQRDFLACAKEGHTRGHTVTAYVLEWQGEQPAWLNVVVVPVHAWESHRRYRRYSQWMKDQNIRDQVDLVIGFNKMPELDVYFAADPCYAEKVEGRGWLYRRLGRCKHFSDYEASVFGLTSTTEILTIAPSQNEMFTRYYNTPRERLHLLPPGIDSSYQSADKRDALRDEFRREFDLADGDLLLLMIGSGFKTKGLDRALEAMAKVSLPLRKKLQFFIVGQDNPNQFLRQAENLGLSDQVRIFPGRDDVRRFMFGADLYLHPAYFESAGKVLIEAMASGLPVLVTKSCGYAHYVADADAGRVIGLPFEQEDLNQTLIEMLEQLTNTDSTRWSSNGMRFTSENDLYSQPKHVVDFIEGATP